MRALLRLVQKARAAETEGRYVQVICWAAKDGRDNRDEVIAAMKADGRLRDEDHTIVRIICWADDNDNA